MNSQFVIDASVVARWYLTDEDTAERAVSLFEQFVQGRVTLFAPSLIMYEVPRALHRALRRRWVTSEMASQYLLRFLDLELTVIYRPEIISGAHQLAERYQCNFYDSCYLALAELLGAPFVLADQKLQRQLAGRLDYLVPLNYLELRG